MNIRRITLTLPSSHRATAEHDGRAIADALARGLITNGAHGANVTLEVDSGGRSGIALAGHLAHSLAKGGQRGR